MEGLAELLPLLFLAVYYLMRGRQRAAQKRARQAAPQQPLIQNDEGAERRSVSEPTPFQQFMQQIEEAVAEASGEPLETEKEVEVEKLPAPSLLPAPPVKPVRPAPLETASEFLPPEGSFSALQPVDHERHGFGAANPLSEQSFEQRPRQQADALARHPAYDPHGLASQPPRRRPEPSDIDWRRRLRDPVAAREAFLLQTIFGPRGGRRGEGPRG